MLQKEVSSQTQGHGSAVDEEKQHTRNAESYNDEMLDEQESEVDEEHLVLRIDGERSKPFDMKGLMCGNHFNAIIDRRSPVSAFTKRELQKTVS